MVQITITFLTLLVYIVVLSIYGGRIPPSLSDSVFYLKQEKRWIWTLFLFIFSFLTIPVAIEVADENTKFLAFLAIAALAFVGAAPLVRDTSDIAYKVHCWAAAICAACSQLLLLFNSYWFLLLWVPWGITLLWFKCRSQKWRTMVFWGEMVCFTDTLIFCLISVLN